jgi:hypothetical protein
LKWICLKGRYYNLDNVNEIQFKDDYVILYFIGGSDTLIYLTELESKKLKNELTRSSKEIFGRSEEDEDGKREIV